MFAHLTFLGSEIIFLQETYLHTNERTTLERGSIGQIFCYKYEDRSRATALLIQKGIAFVPTSVIADNNGRYIILAGKHFDSQIVFC